MSNILELKKGDCLKNNFDVHVSILFDCVIDAVDMEKYLTKALSEYLDLCYRGKKV